MLQVERCVQVSALGKYLPHDASEVRGGDGRSMFILEADHPGVEQGWALPFFLNPIEQAMMKIESGHTLLFIGDSITDAGRTGQFPPFGQGWMSQLRAMALARRPDLTLNFINKGVSGNTIRDLAARWERDVLQEQPHHLFVMIGINDVWRSFAAGEKRPFHVPLDEFLSTYEELVQRAVESGVKTVCLIGCFFAEPNREEPMRRLCDEYNDAVEDLARRHAICFISSQRAIDRLLAHQHPMMLASDRVHPETHGHMAVASEVYRIAFEGGR